jgi:hypothetical protein
MAESSISFPDIWHTLIEKPFMAVGLFDKPIARFVVVSGITAGILYYSQTGPMPLINENNVISPRIKKIRPDWIGVSLFMGTLSVLFV